MKLKTPRGQIASEIEEALAKRRLRSAAQGGAYPAGVAHARRKGGRASRVTAYHILFTPDEVRVIEFAQGRYAWPDVLAAHVDENGAVGLTESEMWQWTEDVDSDAEGGHSPFPLASDAFADKLQRFYDSVI